MRARQVAAAILLLAAAACSPRGAATEPGITITRTPTVTQHIFPPTFTPGPTSTSRPSETPRASITPAPTQTLGPTLPPTATPLVQPIIASETERPVVPASLLFRGRNQARIWNGLSGTSEIISADIFTSEVSQLSFSNGGSFAGAAFPAPAGARIVLYSIAAGEIVRDIQVASPIVDLAISPGGSLLAYVAIIPGTAPAPPSPTPSPAGGSETGPTSTPTATPVPPPQGLQEGGQVFLLAAGSGSAPAPAGACGEGCTGVVWSPAGGLLLWGDADGLWGVDPAGSGSAVLIAPPFVVGVSGAVQQTDSYHPISVSPSGRFILARKGLSQGTVLAIVDGLTGAVANVPGTGEYTGAGTAVIWLPGDVLFIGRPGVARLELLPAVEIWGVSVLETGLDFGLVGEIPLPGDFYAVPAAPALLPDGRVGFTLINLRDGNDAAVNGLYLLELGSGSLLRVNYLPLVQARETHWLPDASAALVVSDSRLLFVPAGYGPIYSLAFLLGEGVCCFEWTP